VPILWDGDCVVWDSLAIVEFLADRHGKETYWPQDEPAAGWRDRWRRRCTPAFRTCAATCR
jgi:glutathione S-transferase